jgi:hypothetical protein
LLATWTSTRIAKEFCCANKKGNGLTKHDWNVRQKEDQVDQIMLAFPDGEGHYGGLDGDYSALVERISDKT